MSADPKASRRERLRDGTAGAAPGTRGWSPTTRGWITVVVATIGVLAAFFTLFGAFAVVPRSTSGSSRTSTAKHQRPSRVPEEQPVGGAPSATNTDRPSCTATTRAGPSRLSSSGGAVWAWNGTPDIWRGRSAMCAGASYRAGTPSERAGDCAEGTRGRSEAGGGDEHLAAWALGWVAVAVQMAAIVLAGRGVQRRLVPSWRGAPAVMAASASGLGVLVSTSLVLGSAGLFRRWPLVVALVAVAWCADPGRSPFRAHPADAGTGAPGTAGPAGGEDEDGDPRGSATDARDPGYAEGQWSRLAAVATVAVLAASWLARVAAVYRRGSSDGDSLMYHLPFAARFVQTGWTTGTDPIGPDAWVAFYPATVELLQATLMLPWRSDALVPLMNLGWLALALLAGWCLGATVGRPSLGLVMAAPVAALPVMIVTQAGTARVDMAAVALTLTSVSLLFQRPRTTRSCALAGLALGLAVGSKMAVLPLAGALVVAVAAVLWRRGAAHQAWAWGTATVAAGSYWYVRNWVVAGSPVPAVDLRVGGVGFAPLPADRLAALAGTSIVDRMKEPGFYHAVGLPVVREVTGSLPLTAALVVAAAAPIVWLARRRPVGLPHAVAAAAVMGGVAYLVAPNGAPWPTPTGDELSFAAVITLLNVRYVLPCLAVLLFLVPLATRTGGRWRGTGEAGAVLATLWMAWVATRKFPFDAEWPVTRRDVLVAVALVAAGLATYVASRRLVPDRPHQGRTAAGSALALSAATVLGALVATGSVAAGWSGLDRYETSPPGLTALWRASEASGAERIALVSGWLQYPHMAPDLSTEVEYIGLPRNRGLSQPPRNCAELTGALRLRHYDAVVVQRVLFEGPGTGETWDHVSCVMRMDGTRLVIRNNDGAVFLL